MKPFTPRRTRLLLAAAAAGAALIGGPAVSAHATPGQDQQFYSLLRQSGLVPTAKSVTAAHYVCARVWQGSSPWTVTSEIWEQNAAASWDDATTFVYASISVYCPPVGGSSVTTGGSTV